MIAATQEASEENVYLFQVNSVVGNPILYIR